MSVTISDLLKLPSLRNAQVIAGRQGLCRIVTSVSVLEYAEPSFLQEELFENNAFYGSEIVITAFANIKDNVDAQCANIIRLNEAGEVGLILYYVGVLLKQVDPRLIALCDELGFTLICMPKNRMDLRYSEAICEIMETIYQDQSSHAALTAELLERISHLPPHQRTIDTILKMLSDRLHISLLLAGESGGILNAVAWPRTSLDELTRELASMPLPPPDAEPVRTKLLGGSWLLRLTVTAAGRPMSLLILDSSPKRPEPSLILQIGETVQLAVNLWGSNHDQVAATELVRAILQDEPLKMRRLAEIFHVDVASIHHMWILHGEEPSDYSRLHMAILPVTRLAREHTSVVLCDLYETDLLLFMDGPASLADSQELCDSLEELLKQLEIHAVITRCFPLADTAQVRAAFLSNRENLSLARRIFPGRKHYTLDEIQFARSCGELLKAGEQALETATAVLLPLKEAKDGRELLHTLEVFLLDCSGSVTQTARLLFLHPNTVKYRVKRLCDLFGRRIDKLPASMDFYRAAALMRLLEQRQQT